MKMNLLYMSLLTWYELLIKKRKSEIEANLTYNISSSEVF